MSNPVKTSHEGMKLKHCYFKIEALCGDDDDDDRPYDVIYYNIYEVAMLV